MVKKKLFVKIVGMIFGKRVSSFIQSFFIGDIGSSLYTI